MDDPKYPPDAETDDGDTGSIPDEWEGGEDDPTVFPLMA